MSSDKWGFWTDLFETLMFTGQKILKTLTLHSKGWHCPLQYVWLRNYPTGSPWKTNIGQYRPIWGIPSRWSLPSLIIYVNIQKKRCLLNISNITAKQTRLNISIEILHFHDSPRIVPLNTLRVKKGTFIKIPSLLKSNLNAPALAERPICSQILPTFNQRKCVLTNKTTNLSNSFTSQTYCLKPSHWILCLIQMCSKVSCKLVILLQKAWRNSWMFDQPTKRRLP